MRDLKGISARRTRVRRAKFVTVWDAFKECDFSFTYKDFLDVWTDMYGRFLPTNGQFNSDLAWLGRNHVRVYRTRCVVPGIDYRTSMAWLGPVEETVYYHTVFPQDRIIFF